MAENSASDDPHGAPQEAPTHDFKWRWHENQTARSLFLSDVLLARQIAYDLSEAVPAPGHRVVRHDWTEQFPHRREELGLHLALVHLVGRVDYELGRALRSLWESRRDLLEVWVGDHFRPRVGSLGSLQGGDEGEERGRRRQDPRAIHLPLAFSDVWAPSTRGRSVEDYVRDKIFGEWDRLSPLDKIRVLRNRILNEGEPLAEEVRERFRAGLEYRNRYVHPRPEDMPPITAGQRHAYTSSPTVITRKMFDEFAESTLDLVDWLYRALGAVSHRWIATNVKGFRHCLTDAQALALGGYRRNSGDSFSTLDLLLAEVEQGYAKEDAPRLLLLKLTDEVVSRLGDIEKVKAERPGLPIVLYYDHSLHGDAMTTWQSYMKAKINALPTPSKPSREAEPAGLQRLAGFRVVHDYPFVFDLEGRSVKETDERGKERFKTAPRESYDRDTVLQRAIEEATQPNTKGRK